MVTAIGARLAGGQTLTDAKPGLVESLGTFTRGAVNVAGAVATAPTQLVDPTLREKPIDAASDAAHFDAMIRVRRRRKSTAIRAANQGRPPPHRCRAQA